MLTAREPSVKPLADVVRCYIRCDGQHKSGNTRHFSHLPSRINGRARPQNHYTTRFAKKIQGMPRAGLSYRGKALLRTTSQSRRKLLDSSPSRGASGETVHFAQPAKASPFGRGVTEGDGEGKPGRKEPRAQRWAGSLSERCYRSVWDSSSAALPSQSHFVRQLSQRESL